MPKWFIIAYIILHIRSIRSRKRAELDRWNFEARLLHSRWMLAMDKRLLWQELHLSEFNVENPEYQRLWELEIRAEDRFRAFVGANWNISQVKHEFERKKFWGEI